MKNRIRLQEKIGYGFGDLASSMFWKLFSMYLMFFYTDIVELSPASVGTMLLLTRLWDGLNDPIMGIIADRTQTKFGKFRPYLLWVAIPFAIIGILTFSAPDFSPSGKLIYAYITYTLMMMVYTAINVPYSSLMGVMTSDTKERTSLASFRFIGAYTGGIFMTATVPYMLDYFKNTGVNQADSFQYSVMMYAFLAALFFVLTFLMTKERVAPLKEKISLKNDLKDLAKNAQWFIVLGAGISILIFNSLRDGSIAYYFKYFVKDQEVPWFGYVTWDKLAGAYMTVWLGSNLLGVLLAEPVSQKIGKKTTFVFAMILASVLSFMLYWLDPENVIAVFILNVFIGITAGIVLPLIWSMYADIADYSEWKTGRRATGLIFSSSSMSQKLGWTLGGAVTGWLLAFYGFEANIEQSQNALKGIKLLISVYPAIGALLSVLFIIFYKLSDSFMTSISNELYLKRNGHEK